MRILHFSDVHFWRYGLDRDPTFKRALGWANLFVRRARRFPPEVSHTVLSRISHTDADVVCFTGDISTSSLLHEFEAGRQAMRPLVEKWRERLLIIPGNHDRYTNRSARKTLFEEAFAHEDVKFPYRRKFDGFDFIGVDATRPCFVTSRGAFPSVRQDSFEVMLKEREAQDRPSVVLCHYPYALPDGKTHRWHHRLKETQPLGDLIAAYKPRLLLHGHVHRRWAHTPVATPDTVCVNSGSAGMLSPKLDKNAGFALIDLDEKTGDVTSVTGVQLEVGSMTNFVETKLWPHE